MYISENEKINREALGRIFDESFIEVTGMPQRDRIIYDPSNLDTQKDFKNYNGQFSINHEVIVVILDRHVYVSPLGSELVEKLEKNGLTKNQSIYVPLSDDPYWDYPFSLGKKQYLRVAANNIYDPIGHVQLQLESTIFENPKFRKWERLLRQARGFTLSEWHKKIFKKLYEDSTDAKERKEQENENLRLQMIEVLRTNPETLSNVPGLKEKLEAYYKYNEGNKRRRV